MANELIAAYTPATSPYPPYINVSRDGDDVTITVRSPPGPGGFSSQDCGATNTLHVSAEVWAGFMAEMSKRMVDRFLGRRLPEDFRPDNGISFKQVIYEGMSPENQAAHWPVGTNLFDATQANAMVRHMLGLTPKRIDPG